MQALKEVTDADLDHRMTEETKIFVTKFLQTTDPTAITRIPLEIVRQTRDNNAKLMNEKLNIPDLIEKEYFVKNIKDGYQVPITAYIPSGIKPDSSLVVFFHGGGWTFCNNFLV
jgi:acetyl esterase/lipase